jgi:hypothetical protein
MKFSYYVNKFKPENRVGLEERKRRENCDRVKTLISSKKQEFEKSINS